MTTVGASVLIDELAQILDPLHLTKNALGHEATPGIVIRKCLTSLGVVIPAHCFTSKQIIEHETLGRLNALVPRKTINRDIVEYAKNYMDRINAGLPSDVTRYGPEWQNQVVFPKPKSIITPVSDPIYSAPTGDNAGDW